MTTKPIEFWGLERHLRYFVSAFEQVFDNDWPRTEQMIRSRPPGYDPFKPGETFLRAGPDEQRDGYWSNYAALIESYRRIRHILDQMRIEQQTEENERDRREWEAQFTREVEAAVAKERQERQNGA